MNHQLLPATLCSADRMMISRMSFMFVMGVKHLHANQTFKVVCQSSTRDPTSSVSDDHRGYALLSLFAVKQDGQHH